MLGARFYVVFDNLFMKVIIKTQKTVSLKISQNFIQLSTQTNNLVISKPDYISITSLNKGFLDIKISNEIVKTGHQRKKAMLWVKLFEQFYYGLGSGFIKTLEIVGIGYKAEYNESAHSLKLKLGWSNWKEFQLDERIQVFIDSKGNKITLFSKNFQLIGQYAAKIRSFRIPEPYKGKGIRYQHEKISLKQGKHSNV